MANCNDLINATVHDDPVVAMVNGGYMNSDCNPICPPQIQQGEDKTLTVRLTSGQTGLPYDLTNCTAITAAFLNADGSTLECTLANNAVQILSAPGGAISITLTAAQTALLAVASGNGYQSFQLEFIISSLKTIVQLVNSIQVVAPLFTI